MPDEILPLPEIATLLEVPDKTVYTMEQKAETSAFKIRGQWRFKRQDIDPWIADQKSAQRDDARWAARPTVQSGTLSLQVRADLGRSTRAATQSPPSS